MNLLVRKIIESLDCAQCGKQLFVGYSDKMTKGHTWDSVNEIVVCEVEPNMESHKPKEEYTSMGFTKYNGEPKTRTGFDGVQ